eukprot:CAMPEP_0184022126 /NCGR_PEP_ID=MMETSP0954-20121128/10400_1 /TAXON_ID=627963 /ORGANISM="Aplanochytrium sp, Strain PBS07" /LENGTH=257 /DNA_ID=CAMNT_0026304401 /DNA_START=270 /DNA_END=1044 /DNA_ORIENTATION=-
MRDTPKHEMRRDAPAKLFSTGDVSEGPISVKIIEEKDDRLVFDLMNCDAPIANAFRRIMIAEVPTIAIETVLIAMNTSIIQDEVLAHRLGLVPLNVDPESLQENEKLTFRLDFKCKKNGEQNIYSRDLKWVPDDDLNQSERLSPAPATIHDDILIAKLAPGQVIELEMVCVKGIGKDHAKFSPVCTASYRAMPEIQILREGFDDESKKEEYEKLVSCCPMNVFDIEDIGGEPQAVVANQEGAPCAENALEPLEWNTK